ncbi:SDR family oxidoreductase [Gorillibacterium sp. sgz5001074]|uniref:SDR family oxidoreductase n=1 Tax=Gorillibacterium sp. sgz5001074 TaxID=3446695 RepID=UPI003F66686B
MTAAGSLFDWNSRLRGMTVAVTGASRGIGRETALQLAQHGAKLVLGARDMAALEQLAAELQSAAPEAEVAVTGLDVTDEDSVRAFVRLGAERFGRVDALVNNAGFGVFAGTLEMSADDFSRMVDVNLKGAFHCAQAFGRLMVEQGRGHILNLVSIAGTTALAGCAGYSASKFGLLGLTKVLQTELRRQGVQVTAVIPGSVKSSFWDGMESTPNLDDMIPTETLAAHLVYLLGQPDGAFIDEITIMPPKGIL